MTSGRAGRRSLAALLIRHAAWVSPANRKEWFRAMTHELDHVPGGASALEWALGCALVGYMERIHIMTRSFAELPRWLLALEMAVCLVPLTWLFIAVLAMTGRALMPLEFGILAGSATLSGPLGLAVALRLVFLADGSVGRATTLVLALLAAWTMLGYTGQLLHDGSFLAAWREFILLALLPAMAVAHLLQINSQRRQTRAIA
jgi:hypothetical protein